MGRRRAWTVEALEGRDLLSVTPILGLLAPKIVSTTDTGSATTAANGAGSGVTADGAAPRPNEVARRAFRATFAGRVVEEPPRLVDQARQFYVLAPGNTNQFLHGTLQMRYFTPEPGTNMIIDGVSTPATTTTGAFSISDRSTQSGAVLLGDLSGDPTQVDAKGRPTQFTFTVNGGGGSGGIYASSVGGGTVNITYQGNVAKVLIVGSIYIYGIGEPLDVFQSNTHH